MGFLLALLILGLLVYLVMLARRDAGRTTPVATSADSPAPAPPAGPMTPTDVVKMRYARGEISKEEYETMRRDLE